MTEDESSIFDDLNQSEGDSDLVTYKDIAEAEEATESTPLLETEEFEKQTGQSGRIETMDDLTRLLAYRARNGYDSLTAWCGIRNIGKSVGAQQIAQLFQGKFSLQYDLKRDTMFKNASVNDIMNNIKSKPLNRIIILDEAERYFYRMDWQSQEQNELIKFISFARIYRKHLFLLLPHFTDMRTSFRNNEITLWIQGLKQGFAVVFMQDTNLFEEDRWHMKENKKTWQRYARGRNVLNPDVQLDILSHTVNYIGDFHFDDLPTEWKEEYQRSKLGALNSEGMEVAEDLSKRQAKYQLAFQKTIPKLLAQGMKPKEIADLTGLSSGSILGYIKKNQLRPEDKPHKVLTVDDI